MLNRSTLLLLATVSITSTLASRAHAAFDGDLVPQLVGNTIITNGISDEDGSLASNVSVFQYTLGELTPGYTEDPGFQPMTNSNLPANTYLGFNIVSSLMYWNGVGTPTFTSAPAGTQITEYLGPTAVYASGTTNSENGFVLQQLTSQGAGHRHLNTQLLGAADPNGSIIDNAGNTYDTAPDGVYALAIQVTDNAGISTTGNLYTSATTWLVFGNNVSDDTLTTGANTFITGSSVPEPASLTLLAAATPLLLRRRK